MRPCRRQHTSQHTAYKHNHLHVPLRGIDSLTHPHTPSLAPLQDDEFTLSSAIQDCQSKVHEALLDNINTPAALEAVCALIKATNTYLAAKQAAATATAAAAASSSSNNGVGAAAAAGGGVNGSSSGSNGAAAAAGLSAGGPQPLLLRKAAAYVTRILSVFGLLPVSLCVCASLVAQNMT